MSSSADGHGDGLVDLAEGRRSSYGPDGFKPAEPATFVWTVRFLDADSEEGRRLRVVQAAAVRKVLQCLRQRQSHPPSAA